MLDALAEHFPPQAEWTRPGGGLFVWATLPDFIDTTDLLARALRDNVAFVPGEAAFLDGRGRSSMRLNFSGSDEESIREGIRRIGEVVTEQVELYGTLTGERAGPAAPGADVAHADTAERARRAHDREGEGFAPGRAGRSPTRVAVLKGGRSLGARRSRFARERASRTRWRRLGHEVVAIDVGLDLIQRLRDMRPDAAFIAMHGRDGEDGTVQELLELLDVPYTGSGVLACVRSTDKVLAKHLMLEAGIPTPEFFAFNETAFRELGAAEALGAIEERLDFPIVVKPSSAGLGARDQVRPLGGGRAGGAGGGVLLRLEGPA